MKLFIATPALEGKVCVPYCLALLETVSLLKSHNIEVEVKLRSTGSLLVKERNRLLEEFWHSDCSHMLCVDADLGWQPKSVLSMLEKDEDCIVGCYPCRRQKQFLCRPVFNPDNTLAALVEKKLIKMELAPAGFMLFKRHVLAKMRDSYPDLYYEPKVTTHLTEEGKKFSKGYCLFETKVQDGEFWGEDYIFCSRMRQCGFDLLCDPTLEFDHAGVQGALIQALVKRP